MRRTAAVPILLCALLLGGSEAWGFELLRVNRDPCSAAQNLYWADGGAAVSSGGLPLEFQGLVGEARSRWNQSVRGFVFRPGAGASCVVDGTANLAFSDRPCGGMPADFSGVVAVTRSVWNQDGRLVDADVVFNASGPAAGSEAIFLEVALHELGHVLGLDHSDACGRSGAGTIMKAFLGPTRLSFPQADDIEGAEFLYPTSSGGGTVPEGANSCAIVPPRFGGRAAVPALVVPLLFFLRRRAGRRFARKTIDEPKELL